MLNRCTFIGNIVRDPETGSTESGRMYARFSLACNERGYKKQDGTEVPERVEYINCIAWNSLAENIAKFVKKGDKLYLEGKFRTREYEASDGSKRRITEIYCDAVEFLGGKREKVPAPQDPESQAPAGEQPFAPISGDLPF